MATNPSSPPSPPTTKVIAITGAASGIGLALAHLLASPPYACALSLADIRPGPLSAAAAAITAAHPTSRILTRATDVADAASVDAWLDETVAVFGRIDGAANLAGIIGQTGAKPLWEVTDGEWEAVMGVNVRGVFNCMRGELSRMVGGDGGKGGEGEDGRGTRREGRGAIVNAASTAGLRGLPMGAPYCATKHAVIGLTTSAAAEAAPHGIRVNAIAPGATDTPMLGGSLKGMANKAAEMTPMGRVGRPEEVAGVVAWLLGVAEEGSGGSLASGYVTGVALRVDGGLLA